MFKDIVLYCIVYSHKLFLNERLMSYLIALCCWFEYIITCMLYFYEIFLYTADTIVSRLFNGPRLMHF